MEILEKIPEYFSKGEIVWTLIDLYEKLGKEENSEKLLEQYVALLENSPQKILVLKAQATIKTKHKKYG